MSCSRLNGVRPAACTSPTKGSDILPSDRTGIPRCETSGSFQTLIVRTSSLPITKLLSCGLLAAISEGGVDGTGAEPACAHNPVDMRRQTNSSPSHSTLRLFFICAPEQSLINVVYQPSCSAYPAIALKSIAICSCAVSTCEGCWVGSVHVILLDLVQ